MQVLLDCKLLNLSLGTSVSCELLLMKGLLCYVVSTCGPRKFQPHETLFKPNLAICAESKGKSQMNRERYFIISIDCQLAAELANLLLLPPCHY